MLNYRDLEIWVRGHSRSLKVVPFESLGTVSYLPSIVTGRIFRHIGDIQRQRMAWPWYLGLGSFEGIETFKILTGRERIDSSNFSELSETTSGLRGHSLKLYKQRCCTTVRQCFYSSRVINSWNRLPPHQDVVEATSVNMFKNRLDKHWKDMGVYSWLALQLIIPKYTHSLTHSLLRLTSWGS